MQCKAELKCDAENNNKSPWMDAEKRRGGQ